MLETESVNGVANWMKTSFWETVAPASGSCWIRIPDFLGGQLVADVFGKPHSDFVVWGSQQRLIRNPGIEFSLICSHTVKRSFCSIFVIIDGQAI